MVKKRITVKPYYTKNGTYHPGYVAWRETSRPRRARRKFKDSSPLFGRSLQQQTVQPLPFRRRPVGKRRKLPEYDVPKSYSSSDLRWKG